MRENLKKYARFNIIEHIVSMRVFNLEVNIEISYELAQEIKSQEYNIELRPSPLEIEIMNKLIDKFIKNKDLVNKFIQISRDRKINYLMN